MFFGLALAWFSVGFFAASCCWWLGIKWQARRKRRVVKGYYGTINVPYSVVGKVMQEDLNRQIRESLYSGSTLAGAKQPRLSGSHGYNLWHVKSKPIHYSDDIYFPVEPDDDEDY